MTSTAPTTLRPTTPKEVRDAVLDTPGRLAVTGAGTAYDWAGRPAPTDATLDLSGLSGVIHHNPGDMTVSVHAGTPLREFADEVGEHGQRLAFDAGRVARGATVGGLVATADAGPSALVYGGMRDLVIGTTTVLADGTMVRSGGHVIKNVAGYDVAKLLHGSYGTLGVLVEVVLRLHPVPKATATVAVGCGLDDAAAHAVRLAESPLEPIACEWISEDAGTAARLLVRLEGGETTLPDRVGRLVELLGDGAHEVDAAVWDEHAALTAGLPTEGSDAVPEVTGPRQGAVVRIGTMPARLPSLVGGLPTTGVTAGLLTGVATVTVPDASVAETHDAVAAVNGTSALRDRPDALDAPAWGPAPSGVAVLKAIKNQLDPEDRLCPGRFDPWM
ncbi:FAD-binding oxidoreductase [Pseudonocardia endophytica]|uniref:Glycolate oxidase FAD binding subunit n=1 Tax=Pseudonocardia endophytica TaxID=401976 RepID=A0A4R1HS98_PSEEN|nr:FAD-binding protein [Pseudonocardia endophytica]TCK25507.1 glycolate oxidase FAD binding subunit [Pseudonocardia endophytica]